jgi:predicted amidohydrolase YtcJ
MKMQKADLILGNARVLTLDTSRPYASAVAVKQGKVLAVLDGDCHDFRGEATRVIDCRGKVILPGFIDAHCHPVGFAESLVSPDLSSYLVKSIPDILDRIRAVAERTPPGGWIRARGYHEYYLAEKRHPTRWELDEAAPLHPVKLSHRSGHAHVLNSIALKLAGIFIDTPNPPGGLIDRDTENGDPTGILYEMSSFLAGIVPPLNEDELDQAMKLASAQFLSLGITSVQDASAGNGIKRWLEYKRWKEQRIFQPRVTMMLGTVAAKENAREEFNFNADHTELRRGAIKILPGETTGKLNPEQGELNEMVMHLHKAGYQVAIHAVGETMAAAACIALENALTASPRVYHRHRIEHCSVCRPKMARRLASLGVAIVTQPAFIYYSGARYLDIVPDDQVPHLYPVADFIYSGLTVAAGSDCPVVPPDPLKGIYGAVSRKAESGREVSPQQSIPVIDALKMYTCGAAYTSFEGTLKGMLSPGRMADMVVLNGDPTNSPVEEIKDMKVEMTIIGGEIAYNGNS